MTPENVMDLAHHMLTVTAMIAMAQQFIEQAQNEAENKAREETKRYGVIDPGKKNGNITKVKAVVEKPSPAKAPSTLCVIGRYILQPEIFTILGRREKGAGGEIQLTDAMAKQIGKTPFHAVETSCARYDCGDKVGFLHANIAVGLARPDIAPALRAILKNVSP